jgi:osmotically-inducible protein OsmY
MKLVIVASFAALVLALPVGPARGEQGAGGAPPSGGYDADNTGRNVRDREAGTKTPGDQGGSATDRDITAAIRRAIVADDSLSTNAHNVKIITNEGVVTLRGPVENEKERVAVAAKAQTVAGVKKVDNQLETTHD